MRIITLRLSDVPEGYTERHHIIPRSLGGTDDAQNVVKLTAREHLLCHKLLAKMTVGKARSKMIFVLHKMLYGTNASSYQATASDYAHVRQLSAQATRELQLERFSDPEEHRKQIERAANASLVAATRNRGNEAFSEACSRRTRRHVQEGIHNFLSGDIQREAWSRAEVRAKHAASNEARVRNGIHTFQDPKFIAEQRERLKKSWADMTPEQRKSRGRAISEGRARNKAKRLQETT